MVAADYRRTGRGMSGSSVNQTIPLSDNQTVGLFPVPAPVGGTHGLNFHGADGTAFGKAGQSDAEEVGGGDAFAGVLVGGQNHSVDAGEVGSCKPDGASLKWTGLGGG